MKQMMLLLVAFLFFSIITQAQDNCNRWSLQANFTLTEPIDEMASNGFKTNFGFTFGALYNLVPEIPLLNFHIGGRITGGRSLSRTRLIYLSDPEDAAADSRMYNTLADLVFTGRTVLNPKKRFQAYFDVYGGVRITGANQDIELRQNYFGYEEETSNRLVQSANLTWGSGAGVLIEFHRKAFLDIGITQMQSLEQRFVDLDSYTVRENVIDYDYVYSVANSVGFHVGIHIILDCGSNRETYKDTRRKRQPKRKGKQLKTKTPNQG